MNSLYVQCMYMYIGVCMCVDTVHMSVLHGVHTYIGVLCVCMCVDTVHMSVLHGVRTYIGVLCVCCVSP